LSFFAPRRDLGAEVGRLEDLSWNGRVVTTLADAPAPPSSATWKTSTRRASSSLLARVTGNIKRGNERR
jgi:hypothetical protein